MARPPDPLHERLRAAIDETWRTAPLGVWLTEHHAEVARLLRGHREPPWERLAADFAAAGLSDGRGRKPDAETARITWEAVCAARPARTPSGAIQTDGTLRRRLKGATRGRSGGTHPSGVHH